MEWAVSPGPTGNATRENSSKISEQDVVFIPGLMVAATSVILSTAKWRGLERLRLPVALLNGGCGRKTSFRDSVADVLFIV